LKARTHKKDGEVISTYISGSSVMVSEGVIYVDWMANYPCLLKFRWQFFKRLCLQQKFRDGFESYNWIVGLLEFI